MSDTFEKPHLSIEDQIDRLIGRGMEIKDRSFAADHLGSIGYYRLSSYWYHMEQRSVVGDCRSHQFLAGTTFEQVVAVYICDQKLRLLVLEAIERLEIAIRATWAHYLSAEAGSHAQLVPDCFKDKNEHLRSLAALVAEVARSKSNSCEVKHYLESYGKPVIPPIWTVVGCMSFGELLRWVRNTDSVQVKRRLCKDILGVSNMDLFDGITRQLSTVRNICAHHGRLWDQRFITKLPMLKRMLKAKMVASSTIATEADNKMYNTLLVLAYLMLWQSPSSSWPRRVADLIDRTLSMDQQKIMGFPENWKTQPLWQRNGSDLENNSATSSEVK